MKKIVFNYFTLLLVLFYICNSCASNRIKQSADAHYKLGLSYLETGDDAEAMKEFRKALNIGGPDPKIYYAISTYYLQRGDVGNAKLYIERAINLDNDNSEYLNAYASVLAANGEHEKAIKIWKKVLEDPTYAAREVVYYNLGFAYYQLGDYDKTIEYWKDSIRENPTVIRPYISLFRLYLEEGYDSKAVDLLKDGINRNPISSTLKMYLAEYYYNRKQYSEASSLFYDIIEVSPNSEEAREAKNYLKRLGLYHE
ncbi:MAG: tetratricopeptide repeat protein [Deferribacterota bacterium]|nr:tetratricopeptide repeat protein [Deferribacterota bacterium]